MGGAAFTREDHGNVVRLHRVRAAGSWHASSAEAALKVVVLVGLELRKDSGGHVKCWQRLAEAAMSLGGRLDLRVVFQGDRPDRMTLSDNVCYEICPPILGTRSLAFIGSVPDHTDIAPLNPRILPALSQADVIHTTDAYF